MDAPRGHHLLSADRRFSTGGSLLSRLLAPGFRTLLDRIDDRLERGAIDVVLPDGECRRLGGRASGPRAEVTLRTWRPMIRLMTSGSVGWYRAWAEGEWSSPDPVPLFELFSLNGRSLGETGRARGPGRLLNSVLHHVRRNDRAGSRRNIAFHYDLGNDFYAAWLDATLTYSSAIFAEPIDPREPLEVAQHRKIALLLDRLELPPGASILDIGCGWGALAEIATRERGLNVTGITLSEEQKAFCERRLHGLTARIELVDYRDAQGMFDGITSVEMVEAVGQEYWPHFLEAVARLLRPGGRAALQLIAMDDAMFEGYVANADFIQTYIFPGGLLISERRFREIAAKAGLAWHDRRGYGLHYAETLRRWRESFESAWAERRLPPGFDQSFADLWRYYLMYCEGGFRGGAIDVAQVTLTKR